MRKIRFLIIICVILMLNMLTLVYSVESNIIDISFLNSTQKLTLQEYNAMVAKADSADSEFNKEPNLNGYGNITINNWKRKELSTFNFNDGTGFEWVWSDLESDNEWMTEDYKVWDGSRLKYDEETNTYKTTHNFNKYLQENKISADYYSTGSKLYDSATWKYNGSGDDPKVSYSLNRFQGTFKIKGSPVGHEYTLSSVAPTENLYINDDMFVFIYPVGTTLVDDSTDINYFMNYLCFWGGTTSFSDFHGIKQLEEAPIIENDPYMVLADKYSMKVVKDNIGDKIDYAYALNPWNIEREFVIDIITSDRAGGGGMYRPKITATASSSTADNVDLVFKVVSTSNSNILVNGAGFKMDYRQTWYPVGVSSAQIYNVSNGYLENTAGNMLIGVHPSTLNDKTEDDTKDYYMHTLHQIIPAPGYYPTSETWEIFVDLDTDGDRSYIVNGIHGKVESGCTAYWEGSTSNMLPMQIALTPIQYNISYDLNGGYIDNNFEYTTSYTIEDNITLPVITLTDYIFVGWEVTTEDGSWKKDNIFESNTNYNTCYGNVKLTAKWRKPSSYMVFIPETVLLDNLGNGLFSIEASIKDFIDTSELRIYISDMNNKLKLVGDNEYIEYELLNEKKNTIIKEGEIIAIFTNSDSKSKNIYLNIKEIPKKPGNYRDKISFLLEFVE